MMLFNDPVNLKMKDADVFYYANFISKNDSNFYFEKLLNTIQWQQDTIKVYGKTYLQPRLTAFFAENNKHYKYSNIIMQPYAFKDELLEIKHKIETKLKISFTSCLANLYRDGNDSNGWHADNEKELGENPMIASVSFGEERPIHFKHKTDKTLKTKITLAHGSLLLMKGKTQSHWLHQIPKTQKKIKKRINLTFRVIT